MTTLFDTAPLYPQGFSYYPDFISGEEEEFLAAAIQQLELHTFTFQGYSAKRKTASFGYDYSFEKRNLSRGKDIPAVKEKQHRRAIISFPVKRRSLYIIQGPARADWQHSISPVQNLRYSITLRTVKS